MTLSENLYAVWFSTPGTVKISRVHDTESLARMQIRTNKNQRVTLLKGVTFH